MTKLANQDIHPQTPLPDAVRRALRDLASAALRTWPGLSVGEQEFEHALAQRVAAEADPAGAAATIHASDLYLALACAKGCPKALSAFEKDFMSHVRRYVATIDGSAGFVDEVQQLLRSKLFVGRDDAPAKIMDYSGRGPMGGWLRVAAIRAARNLKRDGNAGPPRASEERAQHLAAGDPDPELEHLKTRYGREFREAFEATLKALTPREQNILRLSANDGLSSDAIAKLYGVSGAAVRLWLKDLRGNITRETRKRLSAELGGDTQELRALVDLVQSRFDLTLSRVLRGIEPKTDK